MVLFVIKVGVVHWMSLVMDRAAAACHKWLMVSCTILAVSNLCFSFFLFHHYHLHHSLTQSIRGYIFEFYSLTQPKFIVMLSINFEVSNWYYHTFFSIIFGSLMGWLPSPDPVVIWLMIVSIV